MQKKWKKLVDKRTQSVDSIETYTCGRSKDLVSEKEEVKFNNIND